jgi:flagellar motility protein MotE (MotC chaperone)
MSRIITFSLFGVILFSLAAGVSWYLQFRQHQDADAVSSADDKGAKNLAAKAKDGAPDRPLVRPPLSPDADRMANMAATLQAQQDSLKTREQQLATREKQLDLIHDEIKGEHKKLDLVRKRIEAELLALQDKLESIERKSADGENDRQKAKADLEEVKRATLELNGVESKNLKQVAGMYDKMDPDAAALVIQQMVDKGNLDTAVTILTYMKDRQAANLLGLISKEDPSIATQLFERMRYMKTPGAKKAPPE